MFFGDTFAFGKFFIFDPLDLAAFRIFGNFCDAVGNKADGIEAGHVLALKEIHGETFALGKNRNQHICTSGFLPAGALDVQNSALYDPLDEEMPTRLIAGFNADTANDVEINVVLAVFVRNRVYA